MNNTFTEKNCHLYNIRCPFALHVHAGVSPQSWQGHTGRGSPGYQAPEKPEDAVIQQLQKEVWTGTIQVIRGDDW